MIARMRETRTDSAASRSAGLGTSPAAIQTRVDGVDWAKADADLNAQGWTIASKLLTEAEADSIANLYDEEQGFQAGWSWGGTALAEESTSILATRCRLWSNY